ncbi:MAG: 2-dehydropantoate 2-reductase [Lachnospiraceae bacterium]|nr:2-dehydropantoate 2-reductase [Lachnospiraceae bacterium]
MNIYVDFDDCLCETALYFSGLAKELFGVDVPYKDIRYFDLKKSFSLTDEQYEYMMIEGHRPEILMSYEETSGAVETVNAWLNEGHDVSVITGRPYVAYEASRTWLDKHGLDRVKMYCLNKYGRDAFIKNSEFNLEIDDYLKMNFDLAVEDSPSAFSFFEHLPNLKVLVFDRPWNRDHKFPGENYHRCRDWTEIRKLTN